MKILLILVIILFIFGFLIIANENLRLTNSDAIFSFVNSYSNLLIKEYSRGIEITGNIVKFFNN